MDSDKKYKIAKLILLISSILLVSACGSNSKIDKVNEVVTSTTTQNSSVEKLWNQCMGCHGGNGEKKALGKSDLIGGQEKEATIYQLKEYRAGRLDQYGMGALMKGQTQLTDSEIELLARYIENLSGER